jgi:hypothetical protein
MPSVKAKCRSKVFPCPAGDRCPEHRAIHEALDYSIQQRDFNKFLEIKNKFLPKTKAPTVKLTIEGSLWGGTAYNNYHAEYEAFMAILNENEREAVSFYTGDSLYRAVNTWLRDETQRDIETWPELYKNVLTNLDNIAERGYQRPHPNTPLWRGVSGKHAKTCAKYHTGDIITETAYTSTSSNPGATKVFTDHESPVILQIFSTKGIPVSRLAESEYLLPRGMRFKVEGRRKVDLDMNYNAHTAAHSQENVLLITLREIED